MQQNTNSRPKWAKDSLQRHDDACRQPLTKKQGLLQQLQMSQAMRNPCLMPHPWGISLTWTTRLLSTSEHGSPRHTYACEHFVHMLAIATTAHQEPVTCDLTARCLEMCSAAPYYLNRMHAIDIICATKMWQLARRIQSSNDNCLKSVLHGQVPVHNSRTPYIAHQPITIPNQTSAGCYRSSRCQEARDDIHDALSRHIITVEPDELSVVCMDTTDIDNTAFTAKFVVSRQPQHACMDIGHMYEYEHERLLSTNTTEKIIATALVLGAQTHDTY